MEYVTSNVTIVVNGHFNTKFWPSVSSICVYIKAMYVLRDDMIIKNSYMLRTCVLPSSKSWKHGEKSITRTMHTQDQLCHTNILYVFQITAIPYAYVSSPIPCI